MTRYREVAGRLEAIGSELDDLAYDALLQARVEGATARPEADKTLTQARRAIEKAILLLESLDS